MGWYNVVKPCVVGQLHYARPTEQPITVDDEVAAPLVEDGSLTPYPAQTATADALVELVNADLVTPEPEQADKPVPHPRGRRRAEG
ncbi:hypothetical protein MHPYR_180059 [uncultured Mycobacterium sp.]|uniref:Uncharacterized protein n=1 Tax=uncultured Mycobacterium sp. TaxID=171292 RepID=A0A1Y5PCB4_9MYCO|nr:hypothetical protein MHPYR_180059 [uncultured Mycobacterium sp.]